MSEKPIFTGQIQVQFKDADSSGILFFGNIFSLAHQAYESLVLELGFSYKEWFENPDWAVPIRQANSEYFAPMTPGSSYQVQVLVERVGESSFTLNYVFKSLDSKVMARVQLTHAFMSLKSFKKMEIPEKIRARLLTKT